MVFGPSKEQLESEAETKKDDSIDKMVPTNLSFEELRSLLHHQMLENKALKTQVHDLKAELAKVALRYEEEDERIALSFIKQVEEVKKHEGVALLRAEEETERVANKLQRQLDALKGNSERCSRSYEAEQEKIINVAQKLISESQQECKKWKDLYERATS